MPLPPLRRGFSLTLLLALLLSGCAQPVMWPVSTTPTVSARSAEAADLVNLVDQLATEYGLVQDLGRLVSVQPVDDPDSDRPLFVAHTHGFPPNVPSFRQKVSIHAFLPAGWKTLGRVELECADYLNESSVKQVKIEPVNVWLTITGGAGAHSGCLELLRWDGEELTVIISSFSSSPDAGWLTDLNEDGRLDLLLNNSDPYIFCYACGVRKYGARLYQWDGNSFVEVRQTPAAEDLPSELRAFNDRAAELAGASLFADALEQIEQAEAIAPENTTIAWNAIWIRHHLEASRAEASSSSYPLLSHIFAGDWDLSFEILWSMGPSSLFSETPIPASSEALGFEEEVGQLLVQYGNGALLVQPDRADIHALSAWGRFLLDRDDPAVLSGLEKSAELAPRDSRFVELAAAYRDWQGGGN